jgi:hypothetical protein
MRFHLTHYSLRSWPGTRWVTGVKLTDWVIEVSLDGGSWQEIDRQIRSQPESGRVRTFVAETTKEWRFLRIRQTGPTQRGYHHLVITMFELFGRLIEE